MWATWVCSLLCGCKPRRDLEQSRSPLPLPQRRVPTWRRVAGKSTCGHVCLKVTVTRCLVAAVTCEQVTGEGAACQALWL